jgi:hypothetical protein
LTLSGGVLYAADVVAANANALTAIGVRDCRILWSVKTDGAFAGATVVA